MGEKGHYMAFSAAELKTSSRALTYCSASRMRSSSTTTIVSNRYLNQILVLAQLTSFGETTKPAQAILKTEK